MIAMASLACSNKTRRLSLSLVGFDARLLSCFLLGACARGLAEASCNEESAEDVFFRFLSVISLSFAY